MHPKDPGEIRNLNEAISRGRNSVLTDPQRILSRAPTLRTAGFKWKKRKIMSVLPLLSLHLTEHHHHSIASYMDKGASQGGSGRGTSQRQQVHRLLCPFLESLLGWRSFVRPAVLILKLRCHFTGIRIGNRMPSSPGNREKNNMAGWMASSPRSEFVIVSVAILLSSASL